MKKIYNYRITFLLTSLTLFFFSCTHISVEINVPEGGILEDAILIVSADGGIPREAHILGDINLSETLVTFDKSVDTVAYTHYWLIGSMSGDVVYSSVLSLADVDMYTIEPYTGSELAWNIPNNLNAYCSGTTYSFDWWAQTINNHRSHVAANKKDASLWRFNDGSYLGTIEIDLKKKD